MHHKEENFHLDVGHSEGHLIPIVMVMHHKHLTGQDINNSHRTIGHLIIEETIPDQTFAKPNQTLHRQTNRKTVLLSPLKW